MDWSRDEEKKDAGISGSLLGSCLDAVPSVEGWVGR